MRSWVDCEIFADWFHKQFVPAVKNHMSSPAKVLLLLDNAPAHPDESVLQSSDKSINPTTQYYYADTAHGSECARIFEAMLQEVTASKVAAAQLRT